MFNESVAPSTAATAATTATAAATTAATAVTDVKRKTDNYAAEAKFVAPCQFYKTLVNCQAYMAF